MITVNKEKIVKYTVLLIFIVLTLFFMFQRAPFCDEANAWMISKSFNLFELFKIEKLDGHLFIWHTILMPFAKNNLFYPYSMYIINWIFCIIALIIFWNKAPFNLVEKTLITFSYPFFWYFSIVARCYSIGILFLFLILSFWRERLKRPYLISSLLILLANTSAMALIGAFVLGLIFLFDLIKEKDNKKIFYSLLILSAGAIVVFCQLSEGKPLDKTLDIKGFIINIYYFLQLHITEKEIFSILTKAKFLICALLALFLPLCFFQNKKTLFFFFGTYSLLFGLFGFIYFGHWWHYLFFFVYLIASIWFFRIENKKEFPLVKYFNFIFLLLLIVYFLKTIFFEAKNYTYVYNSNANLVADKIKEKKLINKNSKVYTIGDFAEIATTINPYFKNLEIYNYDGQKRFTPKGYKTNMKPFINTKENVDKFADTLDKNKKNLAVLNANIKTILPSKGIKYNIEYKKIYEDKNLEFLVYEIKKHKNK